VKRKSREERQPEQKERGWQRRLRKRGREEGQEGLLRFQTGLRGAIL